MPSILSPSPSALRNRRRPVSQSALFPVDPDAQCPKPVAGSDLAPIAAGPGVPISSYPGSADCPPPCSGTAPALPGSMAAGGAQRRLSGHAGDTDAPLVGIARLAASSPCAESERKSEQRPEYFLLPVRSILNKCDSSRVPFEWTINPYRGCEFACKYCYARYTHEYMELDGSEFEKKIFVKQNAAALLTQDVARKYSYQRPGAEDGRPEHIAIGTATDPYQPAEREYGVTRACLEELAKREGLSISIITKSDQIVRDIDILKVIAAKSALSINITVTTLRPRLARLLEPRAPRPDLRLAALRDLREAGLNVGVSASPLIPGITDGPGEIEAVAEAAKQAGAQWFFSGVLFLMPASAKTFLPFMREKFPKLAKQYDQWYGKNAYAPEDYRKQASERVLRIRQKYGFAKRPWEGDRPKFQRPQMNLPWESTPTENGAQAMRSCANG